MRKLVLFMIVLGITAGFFLNGQATEKFPVTKKKVEGFHFLYYEFIGPYQKAFDKFGEFMAYLKKNGIETGPYSVGIYLDNPQMTPPEKLRSEIGFMVKKAFKADGIYKYKKIESFYAISTWYKSMDEIQGAWNALVIYLMKNKLIPAGPGYEFYKSDKAPTDFSAECFFPIKELKK